MEKAGVLEIYQNRHESDDRLELVILNKDLEHWNKVVAEVMGPALKPAGTAPTEHDRLITQQFGGIMSGQILFERKIEENYFIAMFWPWQDNAHITLKVYLVTS